MKYYLTCIDNDKIEFSLQRLDTVATFLLDEMNKEDSGENNRLTKAKLNQMYYDVNDVIDLLRVEFLKRKFDLNPEDIKNRLSNSFISTPDAKIKVQINYNKTRGKTNE
tara:strand:- start:50 stop:376 length:327 start_codon:yes stop_codon:yes gene_type:complete